MKELRDAIAEMGPEALALYDAIVAESMAMTNHLLTAERPKWEPPPGYDANGTPVED